MKKCFFQLTKKEGQALRETQRENMIDDTTIQKYIHLYSFSVCLLSLSHALFTFLNGLSVTLLQTKMSNQERISKSQIKD